MCFIYGSVEHTVGLCSMCKVFPHPRCPHTREICRNRTAHPRCDVLYLKNAEVESFNGCGYCKWARTSPPAKAAGYNNAGWPGCCRPPTVGEHRLIQAADWRAVSIIHHVQIPLEVKAALESASPVRSNSVPSTSPARSSSSSKPSVKSAAMPIPSKSRSGGSPQMVASSIASNSSRGSGGSGGASSSLPTPSHIELAHKRALESDKPPGSPGRKHVDLDSTTPRRNSGGRPVKLIADSNERRRSVSSATAAKSSPPASSKASPPVRAADAPRPPKKTDVETSSTSSSGSDSIGSGSRSESTVTSDGGFTDYLSDESEAELQRQAEAKAALVVQNEAEELEFRAARQMLANIGVRPPKTWMPDSERNTAARVASTRS